MSLRLVVGGGPCQLIFLFCFACVKLDLFNDAGSRRGVELVPQLLMQLAPGDPWPVSPVLCTVVCQLLASMRKLERGQPAQCPQTLRSF